MFGGSGNYASAVYIAAVKANAVEKVDAELSQFVESVKGSALISQFIKDISVKKDVRVKTIHDIATEAKYSDVTKSFLGKTGFTYYSIISINLLFQLCCSSKLKYFTYHDFINLSQRNVSIYVHFLMLSDAIQGSNVNYKLVQIGFYFP
jgi:hypothetical protein